VTEQAESLEQQLRADLTALRDRFIDEEFSADLYRGLANGVWRKQDGPSGHVSLSWARAESLVNDLREQFGHAPLELAQTGGEGQVSSLLAREANRIGWQIEPLNTGRQDEQHLDVPESPPPADQGERDAPTGAETEWEQVAHREADEAEQRVSPT
jgi:hypothetical protein